MCLLVDLRNKWHLCMPISFFRLIGPHPSGAAYLKAAVYLVKVLYLFRVTQVFGVKYRPLYYPFGEQDLIDE